MKYGDVRDNVQAYMDRVGQRTAGWVLIDLAGEFGIDIQPDKYATYRSAEGRVFAGQVKRALNDLAERGVLTKQLVNTVGRKKEAEYRTRSVTAELAEARKRAEERAELRDRYIDGVTADFAAAGYNAAVRAVSDDTVTVELARDDIEELLSQLRKGA